MAIEEGLETTGKRVTINNFFESIQDIDEIANNAIKSVTDQGSIVDGLVKSIEEIKLEIKEIKAYIMVQEDEEKDRLLEAQDAEQKREMTERALSLQGVDSSDQKTADSPEDQGVSFAENAQQKNVTNPQEQKGFFGSLAGLFGSSLLQLPAALLGAGSNNLNLVQNLNKGGKVNDTDNDKTNNDEDSVPAMLTPGEFVVTKDAVEKVGVDTLKGINAAAGGTNKPKLMEGTLGKGPAAKLGVMSKEFLGFGEDGDMKTAERSMRRDEEGHVEKTYFDGSTDIYEQTADDGSSYFYDKSEMIGSSLKEETIMRSKVDETFEDGSRETLVEETILKSQIVDIAVADAITHKDQLMSEVNKLEGFEKVTFKQILNGTHGIPDELLFPILAKSNASKATQKKKDKAEKLDRKQGILPSSAYRNPTTFGYRTNQINPPSIFRAQESLDEKSRLDFKYDSKNDPTLAKGKKGVKGFSEGGLVGEDVVGEKLKNFAEQFKMDENMNVNLEGLLGEEKGKKMNKVFGGFLNMIKDDVIPNMKEEKLESGAKSILQKGLSSMPVDNISDKIEKSDMPEGVKTLFTDIFGGDKIEKMIESVSTDINQDGDSVFKQEGKVGENQSSFDSKIKNTLEDLFGTILTPPETSKIITNPDETPQGSVDQNKPVTVQANPAQVSDVEVKMTETIIPFMKLIQNDEIQISKNDSTKNLAKNIT